MKSSRTTPSFFYLKPTVAFKTCPNLLASRDSSRRESRVFRYISFRAGNRKRGCEGFFSTELVRLFLHNFRSWFATPF